MEHAHGLQMMYVGGATVAMDFGGLRLLTDPAFDPAGSEYTTGPVTLLKTSAPAVDVAALGKIDIVLLSHDHHFDNLDHAGRRMLPNAGQVLTTLEGAQRLGGNAVGLGAWEAIDIAAPSGRTLRVTGTPARHGPAGGDRGPVTGFVLHFVDEPQHALYVSGDTVWFEGVEEILHRFPGIGVAVLFMGAARIPILPSHITFSAEEAVRVTRAAPSAAIVPVHFEGWKHFVESQKEIIEAFDASGLENRLHWLKAGEWSWISFPSPSYSE